MSELRNVQSSFRVLSIPIVNLSTICFSSNVFKFPINVDKLEMRVSKVQSIFKLGNWEFIGKLFFIISIIFVHFFLNWHGCLPFVSYILFIPLLRKGFELSMNRIFLFLCFSFTKFKWSFISLTIYFVLYQQNEPPYISFEMIQWIFPLVRLYFLVILLVWRFNALSCKTLLSYSCYLPVTEQINMDYVEY